MSFIVLLISESRRHDDRFLFLFYLSQIGEKRKRSMIKFHEIHFSTWQVQSALSLAVGLNIITQAGFKASSSWCQTCHFFHIVFKTFSRLVIVKYSFKMENLRRRSTDATRNWMIGWRKGWMLKVYGALERFWIRSVKVSWHHPVKSWESSPRWVFFKWPPSGLISWTKSDGAVTTATTRTLDDQRASLHRSLRSSTIRSLKTWHHEARQWHPLELPRHPKSPAPSHHVESVLQRLPWSRFTEAGF